MTEKEFKNLRVNDRLYRIFDTSQIFEYIIYKTFFCESEQETENIILQRTHDNYIHSTHYNYEDMIKNNFLLAKDFKKKLLNYSDVEFMLLTIKSQHNKKVMQTLCEGFEEFLI